MGSIDDSTIALWSDNVREKGFFWVSDKAVGKRVDKITETGYPFDKKEGIIFCRISTVGDEVSEDACELKRATNLASVCAGLRTL